MSADDDIELSAEDSAKAQDMGASMVQACQRLGLDPRITVAALVTGIAVALRLSGSPWDEEVQGYLIREVTRMMEERENGNTV